MRIPFLPRRLAILGGGYVGAEFAHIFSALGVEVTLIVRGARLLTHLDDEISARFTALAQDRWHVLLNAEVSAVEQGADGVRVKVRDAAAVDADLLLVATGRIPNSDRMNLAAAGVEVDADGLVKVDDYQRTTADGVWALGDVSSPYQLKHVANQDARVVAHNLAFPHELRESNHRAVPAAVFTEPQIATVGLTEQAAHARGVKYVSAVQHYGFTAFGWALEDTSSVCKLLADPVTQRLLGAHIMGPEASILIQPLIQAIAFGQTVHDVASGQYWIHPALTEVVENALLSLPLDRRLLPA
jgi:mycothione reductase